MNRGVQTPCWCDLAVGNFSSCIIMTMWMWEELCRNEKNRSERFRRAEIQRDTTYLKQTLNQRIIFCFKMSKMRNSNFIIIKHKQAMRLQPIVHILNYIYLVLNLFYITFTLKYWKRLNILKQWSWIDNINIICQCIC